MSTPDAQSATAGVPGGDGLPAVQQAPSGLRAMLGRVRGRLPGGAGQAGTATAGGTQAEATAERTREDAQRREREALSLRREELAQQVSQQHWDLGGLAYEMAVRDHFRLDVLVRRAAVLQERDMELAEVERKLSALPGDGGASGGGSAAAGAAASGATAALGTGAAAAGPTPAPAPAKESAKTQAMRVGAVLLPVFLGFGVLIGNATAGSGSPPAAPVHVVMAKGTPTASTAGPAVSGSAGGGEASSSSGGSSGGGSSASGSSSGGQTAASTSTTSTESSSSTSSGSSATTPKKLPPFKHVFVVMLSDEPYASMFGPESKASYLVHTLEGKGELLVRFYSVAHEGLADRVALVSGQGPTTQTASNCPTYEDLSPGTTGADGQVLGHGCVYPQATATIASQLADRKLDWRAYVGGTPAGSADEASCQHPALGAADPTSTAGSAGGATYATFENPFVYFDSIIDSSSCAANDVSISHLKADLANEGKTPNFAYIAPGPCEDGSPQPCAAGHAAGPAATSDFLKSVVGEILASAAYRKSGLLVITTDQAPATGEFADSSSCCAQPSFPDLTAATGLGGTAPGGGQVGALLLSPYVKGGKIQSEGEFNTFSLLRTFEDLFGVTPLGYAGMAGVEPLAPALFTAAPSGG